MVECLKKPEHTYTKESELESFGTSDLKSQDSKLRFQSHKLSLLHKIPDSSQL